MYWHDALLVLIAMASEFLGTISGFGSSTFFLPIGVLIEQFNFILMLTAVLHIFGNISKLYLFRKSFNFKMFSAFALPTLVLTGMGALLSRYVPIDKLKTVLGLFIMSLALILYFKQKIISRLTTSNAVIAVGVSGFLTGLMGTGGALRGVALASLQLEKNVFVALSSGIDLGGDLVRGAIYFFNGYFDWSHWFYIPLLLVAGYAGSFFGRIVLNKLNQEQFEKIVIIFIFISGLILLFEKS